MKIHREIVQGSPEWHLFRSGKPTASRFKDIVTPTGLRASGLDKYAAQLAGELYAGESLSEFMGNDWTKRGHRLEDTARINYEMRYDVDVEQVGIVTNATQRKKPTVACSPDGLVHDLEGKGGIEVKCLKHDKHVEYVVHYDETGHLPSEFILQTQGELMVCELDWIDLVLYHPKLPMVVMRATKNTRIQHKLKECLAEVIEIRDDTLVILNKYK